MNGGWVFCSFCFDVHEKEGEDLLSLIELEPIQVALNISLVVLVAEGKADKCCVRPV